MTKQQSSLFDTFICWRGEQILRFPWALLLLSVLLCGFMINTLGVDTNTADRLHSGLAFAPHLDTASMGLLLAIGISFTLLCSLIVLPVLSTLWGANGKRI